MFEKIRKPGRAKNFFAYTIFGIICFVFIFLGMGYEQFGLSGGGPAALVNKKPISFADFRDRYNSLQNQFKGRLGNLPAAQRQMMTENLRNRALEDLINAEAMAQAAGLLYILPSDEEVRDYILDIPIFKKEEKFQRDYYENYLNYRKMSAERFENQIRKELALKRLRDVFEKALIPVDIADDLEKEIQSTKINIGFVRLDSQKVEAKIKVSDEEAQKYAASDEGQKSLEEYYNSNKKDYLQEEEVKARHILVKFDSSKPGEKEIALKKIEGFAKELREGADFAELAKKHSEDPGSQQKGGDLGFFGRNKMVKPFEEVAFSQEIGKISGPVESPFGYHLIQVQEKREQKQKSLDEVKLEVAKSVLKESKVQAKMKEVEEIVSKGQMSAVEKWAKSLDLKVEETGLFGLNQAYAPKLGGDEHLIEEVLKLHEPGKMVSKPIAANGSRFILQFKEKKIEEPKDDKVVKDRSQETFAIFNSWAENTLESAEVERNPKVFAN